MSQSFYITITGGTSIGPYDIYYNQISPSNYALVYGFTTPATGLTLNQLQLGFQVEVPDNTTSIIVYNTFCNTYQQIYTTPVTTLYDLCMTHRYLEGEYQIIQTHFIPNGTFNGQPTWISDSSNDGYTYSIIWDTILNQWNLSGQTGSQYSNQGCQFYSSSSYPPLTSWYAIGCGVGLITMNDGNCNPIVIDVQFQSSVTESTCECDGVITIVPTEGTPPFTASIDGGVTFGGMIYTNLCSGTYTILVKDNNNIVSTAENIIIPPSYSPTTYTVSLLTTQSIASVSPNTTTTNYTTTINITPPLPSGVSINFDLSHFNELKSSPTFSSATRTTNSVLLIDSLPIIVSSSSTSTSTTPNTIPSCQDRMVYITGITENWNNLSLNSTTTFVLNTTTTLTYPNDVCVIGECNEYYTLNNVNISGCSCCEIIIG